jgi:protein TonB
MSSALAFAVLLSGQAAPAPLPTAPGFIASTIGNASYPAVEPAAPDEREPAAPRRPAAEEEVAATERTPGSDGPPSLSAGLVASGPSGSAGRADPGTGSGAAGAGTASGVGGSDLGAGGRGGGSRAQHVSGQIVRSDYPRAAIQAREEGQVETRFVVGIDGHVSNCRVTRSSGSTALDQTTCQLIEQRFRWTPARDAHGNPVAEERRWQQTWWLERRGDVLTAPVLRRRGLPDEEYPAVIRSLSVSGAVYLALQVDTRGRVTGCSVITSSGIEDIDRAWCDFAMRRYRFTPALRNSRPTPSTYLQRHSWDFSPPPPRVPRSVP